MTLLWSERALDGLRRARTDPGGKAYDRLVHRIARLETDPATFDALDGVTVREQSPSLNAGPLRAHVMEADVGHVFVLL